MNLIAYTFVFIRSILKTLKLHKIVKQNTIPQTFRAI